jgi:hypothetical protein
MQKKYVSFIFLYILFFPILTFATTTIINIKCNKLDSIAIHAAIISYLDKNSSVPSQEVIISKMQCLDQYASAIVHPKRPLTDDAIVYLHKKKKWKVLSIGTDFNADFLKQIPKKIRAY